MPPATGTALVLLVAFVLPGFVVILLQERTFKRAEDPTPFDRLLRAVYYSLWCYLLLSVVALVCDIDVAWLEDLYERHENNPAHLVWRGVIAVLAPAITVWIGTLILYESGLSEKVQGYLPYLNERHQQPTSWDFWFRKGFKTHVRIVFSDNTSVWGYYGDESFASYAKDGHDLFLEHIYRERTIAPDDASDDAPGLWFGTLHPNGRGAWVNLDEAIRVEFYGLDDESSTKTTTDPPASTGGGEGSPAAAPCAGGASSSSSSSSSASAPAAEEGLKNQ